MTLVAVAIVISGHEVSACDLALREPVKLIKGSFRIHWVIGFSGGSRQVWDTGMFPFFQLFADTVIWLMRRITIKVFLVEDVTINCAGFIDHMGRVRWKH